MYSLGRLEGAVDELVSVMVGTMDGAIHYTIAKQPRQKIIEGQVRSETSITKQGLRKPTGCT